MEPEESRLQSIGSWIGIIVVVIVSMIAADWMPAWNVLPLWMWLAISAAGGGLGFAIGYQPRLAAFVGGVLGGAIMPLALIAYVQFRGQLGNRFMKLELLIPGAIAAAPGLTAYYALKWLLTPADDGFGDSSST